MMKRKNEATRPARGGGFTLTGAKDEQGIPVSLSNHDIERMDRPAIDEYRERRQAVIDARDAKAREESDLELYTEAFVAAGGDASDARASFLAKNKAAAEDVANRLEDEARHASRVRVRQAL